MTDAAFPARAVPRLRFALWVVLAGMIAASLAPTLLVEIPALVDYPNHLGRMSILTRAGTAAESPYYQVNWALYPNLAMDLIVPPLAKLWGVVPATKAFLLVSQIMVLTGAIAVAAATRGSLLLAGSIACLYLYSTPLAFGFVNFEFSLGLALWGVAVWIANQAQPLWRRLLWHAPLCAAMFVAHLFGLALYGFVIGGYELWRLRQAGASLGEWLRALAVMALPVLVLFVVMQVSGGAVGGTGTIWHGANKLQQLAQLNGFNTHVSLAGSAALLVLGMVAARRGTVKLAGPGLLIGGVLALAYVAFPFQLVETVYVDTRIALMAALVLPAFIVFRFERQHDAPRFAAALLALVLANTAFTSWVQVSLSRDYTALLAALDKTGPAPRIFIARTGEEEDPPRDLMEQPMYHAAMMAVHTRNGMVPTLFAAPGKQPLLPRPHIRDLTIPQGGPVPLDVAMRFAARDGSGFSFLDSWAGKFDYLVLLKPEGNPMPDRLEPLAVDRRFALFRVKPTSQ